MKKRNTLQLISKGFILLSSFCLLSISLMAFFSPQAVMDLVAVKLTNNDAVSSIRGVYGGVGLTLFITLLYTIRKNIQEGLGFLCLLWGLYAASRIVTIVAEGQLGAFGIQWLLIESTLFVGALLLFVLGKRSLA